MSLAPKKSANHPKGIYLFSESYPYNHTLKLPVEKLHPKITERLSKKI